MIRGFQCSVHSAIRQDLQKHQSPDGPQGAGVCEAWGQNWHTLPITLCDIVHGRTRRLWFSRCRSLRRDLLHAFFLFRPTICQVRRGVQEDKNNHDDSTSHCTWQGHALSQGKVNKMGYRITSRFMRASREFQYPRNVTFSLAVGWMKKLMILDVTNWVESQKKGKKVKLMREMIAWVNSPEVEGRKVT